MEKYILAVAIIMLIYMMLTLGLNLQYGYTGLINFGHVGFFAVGAYASAVLVAQGLPLVLGAAAAVALAALAAWPLGLLALRLREDYLAIVTLGFAETLRIAIQEERWLTNGVQGIAGIPRWFGSLGLAGAEWATFALLLAAVLLFIWAMRRIVHSPFGRIIQAIRDDEDAVKALGKNPAGFKLRVLVIGAGLAGFAGAAYAHYIQYISPDQFLSLTTFYAWMAMILGGVGRVSGAILGTAVLMAFLEGSRFLRDTAIFAALGVSEVQMASVRLAVVGLALILFTLYRPQGLAGGSARQ